MFLTDQTTAAPTLPTPAAAGTPGYFTNGNPGTGVPATIVDADWLNMLQLELLGVVTAGGLTPSKTTYTQVRDAILQLIQGGAGVTPVVGTVSRLKGLVTAATTTQTFTADEIVVGTALGGSKFTLGAFSKSINLATVGVNAGVGGMDNGAAPASSFVGVYAIANPLTGASALIGQSANGVLLPNVYGGSHMPAGYTESALISVWPTDSSGRFVVGTQIDKSFGFGGANPLSTSTIATLSNISTTVFPMNARTISGFLQVGNNAAAAVALTVYPMNVVAAGQTNTCNVGSGQSTAIPFNKFPIITPQNLFYTSASNAGTPTFTISVNSYEF
ncbi:hypothetical protein PQR33_28110 [Paraburkholderia sediminicola]|uniref:hypothetical protein n=1 Tax=Paraburkholderia sediminicola TaxID=458836 RepID=UPI0038BC6787